MGYYVAVNLSFSANNSEECLKALKKAAEDTLKEIGEEYRYTGYMCEAVAEDPNRYVHGGNKGDMFVWSGVWNYYSFESEEEGLKKFLLNCWKPSLEGGQNEIMFDFDKALLLVNPEHSERTFMYEFRLKESGENKYLPEVLVRTHETELNWNQY